MKTLIAIIFMTALTCSAITDDQAAKAIFGEAGQRSFEAQWWVASVIRNRGSLQGVYGLHNPTVKDATPAQLAKAKRAWRKSLKSRMTPVKFFGCFSDQAYFFGAGRRFVKEVDGIYFFQ